MPRQGLRREGRSRPRVGRCCSCRPLRHSQSGGGVQDSHDTSLWDPSLGSCFHAVEGVPWGDAVSLPVALSEAPRRCLLRCLAPLMFTGGLEQSTGASCGKGFTVLGSKLAPT